MRKIAEAGAFLALAAGLHLIPLVAVETDEGAVASGEGGEALASVTASSASVSAMVEQWETPPEVTETQTSAPPPPAPQPDTAPPPQPQATPDAPTQSAALPDLPQSSDANAVPTAPPPPPAAPEPEPEIAETPDPEPEAEPEPEPEPTSELAVTQSDRPSTRPQRPDPPQQQPQQQAQRQPQPEPQQQAERSTQSSRASSGQRAAGSGGGSAAGEARQAQSATSAAERQSAMAQWGATIRARVERRKSFPRNARQSDGRVVVQIRVARSGALAGASVARSSGDRALDRAALRAVQSAGRFPGAPDALRDPAYTFNLPIAFNR